MNEHGLKTLIYTLLLSRRLFFPQGVDYTLPSGVCVWYSIYQKVLVMAIRFYVSRVLAYSYMLPELHTLHCNLSLQTEIINILTLNVKIFIITVSELLKVAVTLLKLRNLLHLQSVTGNRQKV